MRESLCFALRTPVAVLSSVAPKLPPSATRSLRPRRGFLVCGNLSSFAVPSHWCRSYPYSFVSVFFFFLLPYPGTWGVSCLLGGLRFSASIQKVFCRSCSTCRCISYVFVGRKVISTSYSSAILKLPPQKLPANKYLSIKSLCTRERQSKLLSRKSLYETILQRKLDKFHCFYQ